MKMSDTRQIAATPSQVYAALLNPEVLKACVPGATEVTGDPKNGFEATVVQKVGPVKATFKGQVQGIMHGSSTKNTLVFLEPSECIDINNEVTSLEFEERKEVQRILKELTAFLSGFSEFLKAIEQVIFKIDEVHARAVYAYKTGGNLPRLSTKPEIKIIQGINPVLQHFNKEKNNDFFVEILRCPKLFQRLYIFVNFDEFWAPPV